MTRPRDHWSDDAACRGFDVDLFRDDQPKLAAAATIRRFCHRCPVTAQCRRTAERTRSVGIWGALLITRWPNSRTRTADALDGGRRPPVVAPTTRQPTTAAAAPPAPEVTATAPPTTPAPGSDPRRGTCRACDRDIALDSDGRVNEHQTKDGHRACWGEGYLPDEQAS